MKEVDEMLQTLDREICPVTSGGAGALPRRRCAVAVLASLSSSLALVQDAQACLPSILPPFLPFFPAFLSFPSLPLNHTAQILSMRRQALQLLQQPLYPSQVGTYPPLL